MQLTLNLSSYLTVPAMARLKKLATKQTPPPAASPEKSRRKQKEPAVKNLRAPRTNDVYGRHVRQAHRWLQSHYAADGTLSVATHPGEGSEIYQDPAFKNAFERQPNHCSDQALSIYLGWRGFNEDDESEHLDSDSCGTFHGRWHYSDAHGRYEGNPVLSVDVEDTVASIRHKINAAGNQRTHSGAMKKEYMDSMLTWTASKCSLDTAFNYLRFLMTGLGSPPAEGTMKAVSLVASVICYQELQVGEDEMRRNHNGRHRRINDLHVHFEIRQPLQNISAPGYGKSMRPILLGALLDELGKVHLCW